MRRVETAQQHGFTREESGNNIAALDVFFAVQMQLP
jgi:hypothetical protein